MQSLFIKEVRSSKRGIRLFLKRGLKYLFRRQRRVFCFLLPAEGLDMNCRTARDFIFAAAENLFRPAFFGNLPKNHCKIPNDMI